MKSVADIGSDSIRRKFRFRHLFVVVAAAIFLLTVFSVSDSEEGQVMLSSASFPLSPHSFMSQMDNGGFGGGSETILMEGLSLQPAAPPSVSPFGFFASGGMENPAGAESAPEPEVITHIVRAGETSLSVAESFGVSLETILWANDLQANSTLREGQQLLVLPVSGALHLVRPADTLSEVASWYKADLDEIVEFNRLSSPQHIFAGDLLIVPGGTKPASLPSGRLTQMRGGLMRPVSSSARITQGLHPFNAVDFSTGQCGSAVVAAAGGTIQQRGFHSIAGNYIRILHDNGVVTFYGHLSGFNVAVGQRVSVGQTIGYIGHTGYTIPAGRAGCHLHFEVRGARNPFAG